MSERKEPGQLAYEFWIKPYEYPWRDTPHKAKWAAVEAAIYEDAAKCAEGWAGVYGDTAGRVTKDIAAELRAKIGKSNGKVG